MGYDAGGSLVNMSNSSRKLAAIVFTDIAGFTELSARDELKVLKLLENQRKIFQPMVAEFESRFAEIVGANNHHRNC